MVFKSMNDLDKLQKKNKKIQEEDILNMVDKVSYDPRIRKILTKLEESYHTFLTPTGFGSVFLALFSVLRPGDEIIF